MNSVLHSKYLHIATLILVVQAVLFYSASHGENTPLPLPLVGFPTALGSWQMSQVGVVDEDTQAVLRADDLLAREYKSPEGSAGLFMAYFKTQRAGQSPHSPKNCMPGAGFQPVESGTIEVPVQGRTIRINNFVVANGEDEDVVLYWYQSQGRVIADEFAARFYLIEDSIRRHRSDTSLVRVVVQANHVTRERAEQTAVDFVKSLYPVVNSWLPQ